ncbi:MAG: cell division protein FtsQ/DivIB [Solirubrobacterales bacterium]
MAAAYTFWFRDSSFVEVRDVEITGADADASAEAELAAAAGQMSTLHLDEGALRAAVADDPEVAAVSAEANFPHGIRIVVELRHPAGYIEDSSGAILASDGTVLATGVDRPEDLPLIAAESPELSDRATGPALVVAQTLGGAPDELAGQVQSGRVDPEDGPTVTLAAGLELRFGDASRTALKWRAAVAVLADPEFSGADYLDLSVPDRPVAG